MTVEMEFSIGDAEYELTAEGDIEEGDSGHSDAPDYPDAFYPEDLHIDPLSLSKVSPIPTHELEFDWDMLWFEAPFSTDKMDSYLAKFKGDCFKKLITILSDNLPSTFTDKFEEGISETDFVKRCMLELSNELPSLLVDYTVGEFLTLIKNVYFPCGGKKLEAEVIKNMDEKALGSLEQPEEDESYSFY
jgi:hypothetical protein